MNHPIRSLYLLIALGLAHSSYSQTTDVPIIQTEISSDRFRGENDGEKAYFIFEGNVVLDATNLEIKCEKLEIFTLLKGPGSDQEEAKVAIGVFSSIERILATGNVEITQDQRYAMANTAEVQPNEERIVLDGNPIIRQAGYEFSNPGGSLIIDRGAGRISTPGEENARIRLIGPPIGDLGFEPDEEPQEEEPEVEAVESEEQSAEEEQVEAEPEPTEEPDNRRNRRRNAEKN